MDNKEKKGDITFEEIGEEEVIFGYSAGCSGSRSDCCTRVCKDEGFASEADWGKFLEIEGGVIQY